MSEARIVFCHHCNGVFPGEPRRRLLRRWRSPPLVCSRCHGQAVTELTGSATAASAAVSPARPAPFAAAGEVSQRQGGADMAQYVANFRRWARERRAARRQRRASREPILSFLRWQRNGETPVGPHEGRYNAADSVRVASGGSEGVGRQHSGPTALPATCRDLTADEVLSTQMVLPHGVPDEAAWREIQRHGEACVERLNAEAQAREEAGGGRDDEVRQPRGGDPNAAADPSALETEEEPVVPCCICLGEVLGDRTDAAVVLHCGHLHYACAFEWVDLGNNFCPMCRAAIIREG